MALGPSIRPESLTSGYWTFPNGPDGEPVLRVPGDDPETPWFDECWEAVMGRHSDKNKDGVADQVEVTPKREFAHPDGTTYLRINPQSFESFDEVDSTTIVDDGAPD